jgi:predicted PurR-regulated permease PerM
MAPKPFAPVARWLTVGVLLGGGALFLWAVRPLLVPFIWAALIAYVFNPFVTRLAQRTGFHRAWFVVLLYLLLIGLVAGAVILLLPAIHVEMAQLPDTIADIRAYFGRTNIIHLFGIRIDIHALSQSAVNSANTLTSSLPHNMLAVVELIFGSIIKFLAFLVVTFYFLLDAERIAHWARSLVPLPWRDEVSALAGRIDHVLGAYIRGQLVLMGVMAGLAYGVMGPALRLHYALVLALVAGILELFPVVGPLLAWLLALITGLLTPHIPYGWSTEEYAIAILVAYVVVRQLQDNVTIPNVMGRTLQLHPALVLFVVLCGGYLGGLAGLFLAVPTTAVLRVLCGYLYAKIVPAEDRALAPGGSGKDLPLSEYVPQPWTTEPQPPLP